MEIKKLIEKKGRFSKADIAFLIAEGERWGVRPPQKTSCSNCWRDMAIEIAYKMRQGETPKGVRLRGAAARDGVIFKGRLIVNPLDDETLAWMEANNFPKQLLEGEKDED